MLHVEGDGVLKDVYIKRDEDVTSLMVKLTRGFFDLSRAID
jgi:hypothetical protein